MEEEGMLFVLQKIIVRYDKCGKIISAKYQTNFPSLRLWSCAWLWDSFFIGLAENFINDV